jgi:hypothetical protein
MRRAIRPGEVTTVDSTHFEIEGVALTVFVDRCARSILAINASPSGRGTAPFRTSS